jgi:hypothetical protein
MAWLSRVNFIASDTLSFTDVNNLGNDIRAWGDNVNGGGYTLSNVVVSAASITTTGNVGIGRTAVYRLDVLSSSLITARIASTFASGGKTYSEMLFGSALANGGYEIGFAEDTGTPANGFFYLTPFGSPQGSSGIAINPAGRVGIGTSTPAASAALDITSTTGALLVPRMTTTQRNALTATNGMILYNTTDNQMQARVNGAWVAL